MNKFPERMKKAMKAKGMTQQELADKLHVSQVTVGRYMLGKNEPDIETILRICYYLDEEPGYMLGYDVDELAKEEQDEAKLKERQEKQRKEDMLRKKAKEFPPKLFRAFGGEVNFKRMYPKNMTGHDWGKIAKLLEEFIAEVASEGCFSEEELKQLKAEIEASIYR